MIDKGLHPLKIADGYEKACEIALEELKKIADEVDILKDDNIELVQAAMTSLSSKVVSKNKEVLAKIAVKAVVSVANMERRDVNFDLIKVKKIKK